MMTSSHGDAMFTRYLDRIGAPAQIGAADEHTLRLLVRWHQRTVPFENIGIHAGDRLSLEPATLLDRIVEQRRGGICYELNGAFAFLLTHLGFRVVLLPGRIRSQTGWGPPYGHLALGVLLDRWWLVDVGFTDDITPIPFTARVGRSRWQLRKAARQGELIVARNGVSRYAVQTSLTTGDLREFDAMFWWQRTAPLSRFTRSLICTLPTLSGRVTLSGRRMVTTDATGRRETVLDDDRKLLAAYRKLFGIRLSEVPVLRGEAEPVTLARSA